MPLSKGKDRGECRECGRYRQDLYKGFCEPCRRAYGKRQSARPSPVPPSNPTPSKPIAPDYLRRGIRYERILLRLLSELAELDYSEEAIEWRYEQFGVYVEPLDGPIMRAIRSVQLIDAEDEIE